MTTNYEFLEYYKKEDEVPPILGFIFKNPIPNFIPPTLNLKGEYDYPDSDHIFTFCPDCAVYYAFERTEQEVREEFRIGMHARGGRIFVDGVQQLDERTDEEIKKRNEEDEIYFQNNKAWYLAVFPKDQLNSAIMIPYSEGTLEDIDYQFDCDICDTVYGY